MKVKLFSSSSPDDDELEYDDTRASVAAVLNSKREVWAIGMNFGTCGV